MSQTSMPTTIPGKAPTQTAPAKPLADQGKADHYPPDLYKADGVATVLPGPEAVNEQALADFKRDGYLAVANVYTAQEVEAAKEAIGDLIAGRNPEFNGVHVETTASPEARAQATQDTAAMEAIVRKLSAFTKYDSRLIAMVKHATLLAIVQQLGGEAMESYQEMALLKPPMGREKPWHQDHAYFNVDNSKHIVGAWVALDQATIANGCMHVMPGKHHEPVVHFARRDWQICDATSLRIKERCIAVPLEPGGVLFFDSYLPHGTPTNLSPHRRRAMQFHYKPLSAEIIPPEIRMATWGSEGKDVTC